MNENIKQLANLIRKNRGGSLSYGMAYQIARELIEEGVIVPPVKIGQTVYVVSRYYGGFWRTHECKIDSLTIYEKHMFMTLFDSENLDFGIEISEIGKTVFLTKEEAEKALAERSGK